MKFVELDGYKKDLRRLLKKYKSLSEDVVIVKQVLVSVPDEVPASGFFATQAPHMPGTIKVRKVACKSLKGRGINSGLCLLYSRQNNGKRIIMIGLFDRNLQEDKVPRSMLSRLGLTPGGFNRGRL